MRLESLEDRLQFAFTVPAYAETDPIPGSGDSADDSAIWVHPTNPSLSTVIGTGKIPNVGGMGVYDLNGNELQFIDGSDANNVDIRYDFPLDGESVALVAATMVSEYAIGLFMVNPQTRLLERVGTVPVSTPDEPSGLAMYKDGSDYYVFVNDMAGRTEQYKVYDDGTGEVTGDLVRSFSVGGDAEGMVADDYHDVLFYATEDGATIWKYNAKPDGGTSRTAIDGPSGGVLSPDLEGLAIYDTGNGNGYLIVSVQFEDSYAIYERSGDNDYVTSFQIGGGAVDGVTHTDGIEVTSAPLGAGLPTGLFVAQDDSNPGATQNFKFVSWRTLADASDVPLIGASEDPDPAETITINPIADAHVRDGGNANTNFGSALELNVKKSSSGYNRETYLKFDLSDLDAEITSATLRLFGNLSQSATAITTAVYASSNVSWSENSITWNTKPSSSSTSLARRSIGSTAGVWYEFNLTNYLQQQQSAGASMVTLVLKNLTGNSSYTIFRSDEAATNRPELVLELGDETNPPPPPPPPTGETIVRSAVADSYVRSGNPYNKQNFGLDEFLNVKNASSTFGREVYLQFNIADLASVVSAKLRLFGKLSQSASPVQVNVFGSSNTSWNENSITWNTKPATSTGVLSSNVVSGTSGAWYEFDLTTYIKQLQNAGATTVTLVLKNVNSNPAYVQFNSDESASNRPELLLQT